MAASIGSVSGWSIVRRFVVRTLLVAFLWAPSGEASAASFALPIASPPFLIPLDGKSGTITLFSDGRPPEVDPSGFDPLGRQVFRLEESSFGELTLNLHFTGSPLGDPDLFITEASLRFTVDDFDFLPDRVTRKITLQEMAILDAVNGTPLSPVIDLSDFLPEGVLSTDDRLVTLNPISLLPPLLPADFTDPLVLSLTLSAEAHNTGRARWLVNTSERILGEIALEVNASPGPAPIPEPAPLLLLGAALFALSAARAVRL